MPTCEKGEEHFLVDQKALLHMSVSLPELKLSTILSLSDTDIAVMGSSRSQPGPCVINAPPWEQAALKGGDMALG